VTPPPVTPPDPFDLASPTPHAAVELPPAEPSASLPDDGLALEDRRTPAPFRVAAPGPLEAAGDADAAAFADPFAMAAGQPFDPGSFEFADEPGALSLDGEGPPAGAPEPEREPAPAAAPSPAAAVSEAAAHPEAGAPQPPAAEERIPGQRGSRIRAVLVNAVALAALLLVSLAMLVVWRSEGPLDSAALRPSALLRLLRGGPAADGPFTATHVRSGVYERARGAPLLFVSGRAVSRAGAPVAALAVSVEVVRGEAVIARGEAIAGAVPTPEELHGAGDPAALAEVAAAARPRAPARVSPGDAVPFLVAIGDAPGDLDGASLRVAVTPHDPVPPLRVEAGR
jgi:hypothetical protein